MEKVVLSAITPRNRKGAHGPGAVPHNVSEAEAQTVLASSAVAISYLHSFFPDRKADGGLIALLRKTLHAVARRLRKTWTIVRVRDYVAEPKRSGYRALHLIVRRDGFPIEVQLRTRLQDAWANQVEEDGTVLGVGLKFGAGSADLHGYYVAVSEAFALLDRGEILPDEVAATLRARYVIIKDVLSDDREQP